MTHPEMSHQFGFINDNDSVVTNDLDYLARQAALCITSGLKLKYSIYGLAKMLDVKQISSWVTRMERRNTVIKGGWFCLKDITEIRLPSRSPVKAAMDDLLVNVNTYIHMVKRVSAVEACILKSVRQLDRDIQESAPKYFDRDIEVLHQAAVYEGQKRTALDIMRMQCYLMYYPEASAVLNYYD